MMDRQVQLPVKSRFLNAGRHRLDALSLPAGRPRGPRPPVRAFVLGVLLVIANCPWLPAAAGADWPNIGGDKGGTRYSPLARINRENVRNLRVAWTYHTGDAGHDTTIECTPIVIEGVLYV